MIVAKFLNAAHNLVEQKDIKETVIGGVHWLRFLTGWHLAERWC